MSEATEREVFPGVKAKLTDSEYMECCDDVVKVFIEWDYPIDRRDPVVLRQALDHFKEVRPDTEFGQLVADVINALKAYGCKADEDADDLFDDIKQFS